MFCSIHGRTFYKTVSWALFLYILPICLGSQLCLRCDNLPHPRDCDRIVKCASDEVCYVEQVVTESGNIIYSSGCASPARCQSAAGRKRTLRYARDVNEQLDNLNDFQKTADSTIADVTVDGSLDDVITTCFLCCNSSNYCNRNLCDPAPVEPPANQTFCLNCPDVLEPSQCEFFVLCAPHEVCYTEFVNLNGEERYRLGCVPADACLAMPVSTAQTPVLVGKKRFLMGDIDTSKYCSNCCKDKLGNCNRELCPKTGTVPTSIDVSELIKPPSRNDLCRDLLPDACKSSFASSSENCKNTGYANYACRETCRTCVHGGHVTSNPGSVTSTSSTLLETDCFYKSTKYMGTVSTTVSGKKCLRWNDLDPHMPGMPDETVALADNYCRDPDGRGFPWCFTSTSFDWEYCPVRYCQECFYPGQSRQYQGYVSKDSQNNTCSNWIDHVTSGGVRLRNDSFSDGSIEKAKNYCRDIFGNNRTVCFVGDKLHNCSVSECSHDCQDKADTNCNILEQYVCKYEYTQATLCPRTCNMCKFGLLSPVRVEPPPDVCVDNPDAYCAALKAIICDDPDGAVKLCPKTCNVCSKLNSTVTTTVSTTVATLSTKPVASSATSPSPLTTAGVHTTTQKPHWLHWESWECTIKNGVCLRVRYRNCSTGRTTDCERLHNGTRYYNFGVCLPTNCPPGFFTTTTVATTTPKDTCVDAPGTFGCQDSLNLQEICKDKAIAWKLCARSCNLCDTCWDYIQSCNTTGGRQLFCTRDEFAVQYCRQTCGRCSYKPVPVDINSCGDPVANDDVCKMLHDGICICNDPDIRILCKNYCAGKCPKYPTINLDCTPARRRRREDFLQTVFFK